MIVKKFHKINHIKRCYLTLYQIYKKIKIIFLKLYPYFSITGNMVSLYKRFKKYNNDLFLNVFLDRFWSEKHNIYICFQNDN